MNLNYPQTDPGSSQGSVFCTAAAISIRVCQNIFVIRLWINKEVTVKNHISDYYIYLITIRRESAGSCVFFRAICSAIALTTDNFSLCNWA